MENKHSEGIALLSVYSDEDDEMDYAGEEEMQEGCPRETDLEEEEEEEEEGEGEGEGEEEEDIEEDQGNESDTEDDYDDRKLNGPVSIDDNYPSDADIKQTPKLSEKLGPAIVSYGHDEATFSPEREEGEILSIKSQKTSNDSPPQKVGSSEEEKEEAGTKKNEVVLVLDKFLPPPPQAKCSYQLQEKINKFLLYKERMGKSFNAEVRNRKDYRNPDFLRHAVTYQNIDELGSCFSRDVFDPHAYDPADFYDQIEADMKRHDHHHHQQQEKNRPHRLEFISQPPPPPPASAGPADGDRPPNHKNKKSKWDTADVDSGGPPALPLKSSSHAGAGYLDFAQQKRREAEERRNGERKLLERS